MGDNPTNERDKLASAERRGRPSSCWCRGSMADQLPGSGTDPLTGQPAKAGLFIPAKSERHAYSKPGAGSGTSVLGLDKLAAAKMAERGAMPPAPTVGGDRAPSTGLTTP